MKLEYISLHKKIEYYLIENQKKYFEFSIIAKELPCYINPKKNINFLKLDLLGADEKYFYMIEIKTCKCTIKDLEKYEKSIDNFNYLKRKVKLIFIVKSFDKKAARYIKNMDIYKIIYVKDLTGLESYTVNLSNLKIKNDNYALYEYRAVFFINVFFKGLNKYFNKCNFGMSRIGSNTSEINYVFKNNYSINLYITYDDICTIDIFYNKGDVKKYYPWVYMDRFESKAAQIIHIKKIINLIKKLPNKPINYEYIMDILDVAIKNTILTLKYDLEYNKFYKKFIRIMSKQVKSIGKY